MDYFVNITIYDFILFISMAVVIYLYYKKNSDLPSVEEVSKSVLKINSIIDEIKTLVSKTNNMESREERIGYIVTIIHANYNKIDIEHLRETIETLIDFEGKEE